MKKHIMNNMKDDRSTELLLDSNRGVYIPQEAMKLDYLKNVSKDDRIILESGPSHSWYWESWENVLNHAYIICPDNHKWLLHQDGDLWAYRADIDTGGEEYKNLFGEKD